ncbi:MAG: chorismate mutase [Candidatus Gracilibacteria bacterium]|jgi:chorismate mutase
MDNLNNMRKIIDEIDKNLLALIRQRFKVVQNIRKFKKTKKMGTTDKKREKEILSKAKTKHEEAILKKILIESKKMQKNMK